MARTKESERTEQQKKGLSEGLRLKLSETLIYEYMKNPGKKGKVLDEELDDRNMMDVPLQDFYLWIKNRQEEIGECHVWYDYDVSRDKRGKDINNQKKYQSRQQKTNVHRIDKSDEEYLIGSLFEFLNNQ